MKKWIYQFFIFSLFVGTVSSTNGKEIDFSSDCDQDIEETSAYLNSFLGVNQIIDSRVYIESSMIHFAPTKIVLNLDGRCMAIQNLSADENGFFVSLEELKNGIWGDTWTCPNPNCGYENYDSIKYCGVCGTKKPY